MRPRKGILKTSSSYGNLSTSSTVFSYNNNNNNNNSNNNDDNNDNNNNSNSVHAMLNINVLENLQNMVKYNTL